MPVKFNPFTGNFDLVNAAYDPTTDTIHVLKAGDTMSGDLNVPDEVYGSGWDTSLEVPTKNALYDKLEAIASVATLTLYVDKTNGTDVAGKGYASGTGATKTIQYAFNLIPTILGGNVVINITGEAYSEAPILQGKSFSGNYTITIQGVKTTIETLTIGSGSVQGSFALNDSHRYSTIVRGTGTWTTNQRANKWARVVETGDVRLIDSSDTTTLTLTGYPLTSAPTNGQTLVVEEPLTSITNIQIGTDQKGVVINDIVFAHVNGTNQTLFGKYVDVEIYRCSFPYTAASSLWTNKDNNILIADCFMTFMRLFCRNGAKVLVMGGKMFRGGSATRCMHIDEGASVYIGDGLVVDGNNDASSTGVLLGGLGLVNFNGNTPGQASSRQFATIRKFTTGVVNNTVSAPVNIGWAFILFGNDIMPNAQERPTSLATNKLVDTSVNFTTIGVGVGDKVQVVPSAVNTYALVTAVDSATQLSLDDDIFTATTQSYRIVSLASLNTTDVNIALDAATTVKYRNGIKGAATAQLQVVAGVSATVPSLNLSGTTGIGSGVLFATDTNLYRNAANQLATDDALRVGASSTTLASLNVPSGTAPTAPVEGDMWGDSTQKAFITYADGIKQSQPGVLFTQTADATVTNTVAETSIIGTGVGGLTLPANFLVAGKTVRLRVGGVYTTPALATPSIIVKVKLGSTVIATVTTTALLSGATNLEFDGEVAITCRSTGASGTVVTHGDIEYATGVAGTIAVDPLNNTGATTTVDTTASKLLDVTVQWDTATSTRSVKSTITIVEVLN